jgi:hypothetical protein
MILRGGVLENKRKKKKMRHGEFLVFFKEE